MATTSTGNSAKTLFNLLKEINLDAVRRSSDEPFELVLSGGLAEQVQTILGGARVRVSSSGQDHLQPSGFTVSCLHSKSGKTYTYEEPLRVSVVADETVTLPSPNHLELRELSPQSLEQTLIPALFQRLPEDLHLPLARHVPLARNVYSKRLTDETAKANAVYAASTALGGFIPVVNVPLNIADMMILTKNQLVMAYKLALAYGKTGAPTSVMTEMIGVLGSGFFLRQVARGLVGFIPGWGVLPKIAVAYAGTYLVGQGVSLWLRDGQQVTQRELERFYNEALARGRKWAASLQRTSLAEPKTKPVPTSKDSIPDETQHR
jgi:uncharacterized protein (DUF697 family)